MLHADGSLSPGWLRVDGEAIAAVGAGEPPLGHEVDLAVDVLTPGFVDGHCHGGGGASLCTTDPAEAVRAVEAHRRVGTTSIVAGVVTDSIATMAAQVGVLAGLVDDGELAGIHLEGPWLSRRFAGAHDPGLLLAPDPAAIDALLEAGRGAVRLVTIAPELPGGMDAVRHLSAAGVTVAIGHTDADAAIAAEAIEAGAGMATHLFNAMRPIHHRDPGPVPVLLGDPRVAVELIADGVHVDPAVLALAARSAQGGYTLVSDAFAGALAPDGTYRLGGLEVTVGGGVARLSGTGTLASTTLSLHRAVQVMVGAGASLASSLLAASTTPASRLGLDRVGRLAPGLRADLVALTDRLDLAAVMHAGSWVDTGGSS
jgi:N-acetylglucosamine-6-phosphate deacetylase